MSKSSSVGWTLSCLLLLAGCSPAENGSPASGQGQPSGSRACNDRDFHIPRRMGVDVPDGVGAIDLPEVDPGNFAAQWSDARLGFIIAILFSRPTVFSLEENAELQIALSSDFLVSSAPIRLDSGQRGWVLHLVDAHLPDDIFTVKTIVLGQDEIGQETTYTYSVFGYSALGTNDFDYLVRIARTLCADD